MNRAGSQIALDLFEFRFAGAENIGVDRAAFGVHPHRFVKQLARADVVPADDDVFPIDQPERLKFRQGGHEPCIADDAFAESDQAGQRGGSDASLRANQPKSDASTRHESIVSQKESDDPRDEFSSARLRRASDTSRKAGTGIEAERWPAALLRVGTGGWAGNRRN